MTSAPSGGRPHHPGDPVVRRRGLAGSPSATFGLALVAFVVLGLPDGTLGVAWPSMRADLARPVSALGVLLVAQTVGYLVASAANGFLVERAGTGPVLVAAAGTSAVALLGYALASPWVVLVGASVVVGAAAGSVDAGVNAHVALHHGRRAMGLLHAAFGVGATAGPLLVTALLGASRSWRAAYGLLVVAQVVLLAAFLRTRRQWQDPPTRTGHPPGPAPDRHGRRVTAVLMLAAFFVYSGLEIATGQWAYSLLTEQRGVGATVAGLWVAGYWGTLTGGRLVLAFGANRVAPDRLLAWSTAGAVVSAVVLWLDPGGQGVVALPLVGLCLAPIFPTLVSLTPVRLGATHAGHAIGFQLAAAGVGAAVLPGAIAVAIDLGGLVTVGPALTLLAVVLAAVNLASSPVGRRRLGLAGWST